MAEHRVSVPTLRRYEDPENSRDPRIQAVLTQLKSVQIAPEPRAHFRAELRAQLVAVAPRIIAEGAAEHAAALEKSAKPVKAAAPERRRGFLARPLAVAATVACAFMVLLGGAVWMSQKSLPGDALYGLKRASENVRLQMAGNDADKAKEYLDLAATRVAEANDLVSHTSAMAAGSGTLAGGMSPATARLISGNLTSANSDVTSAATLLGTDAVKNHSANPLSTMTAWAPAQQKRLSTLAAAVSNPAVRAQALSSAGLVRAAALRARTLQSRIGSTCLATAPTDKLGPKPCIDSVRPGHLPGSTTTATPTKRPAPGSSVTHQGTTAPRPAGSAGGTSSTAGPGLPTTSVPTLPIPLPTSLPLKLPLPTSGPISTTSCSITVLGIRIGCPSSSTP